VAENHNDRLAIFLPPGSAKSTYGSIIFPAWFLQHVRASKIIAASHTTELAERFGRRVRNLVVEHGEILGLKVSGDSSAAGRWSTETDNEYYAAGVDTGIAGFRADLAIIDDPVRSRQDADSQLLRDRHWDWYKSDLLPRMRPGGRIVLIMTRWHEDDLAARILGEPSTRWDVVSIPAEAEENDPLGRKPGEMLWEDDDYGYGDVLRTAKLTQPARNWSALYQQHPTPDEGNYFNRNWLKPYDTAPPLARMRVYMGSDYATTSDGGDYTAHIVVGIDPAGEMFLLDLWREQATSDRWVEAFCDLVRKWKPLYAAEEQGQIKAGVGPFLDGARGVPDAGRQGDAGAVDPRPHGAEQPARPDPPTVVRRFRERDAVVPGGQARRPSGRDGIDRAAARQGHIRRAETQAGHVQGKRLHSGVGR